MGTMPMGVKMIRPATAKIALPSLKKGVEKPAMSSALRLCLATSRVQSDSSEEMIVSGRPARVI